MPSAGGNAVPDLQDLARILYFSAGIIKRRKSPGGEINFRAAPCTGALYEIELYIVTGELIGAWRPACITSIRRMYRYGYCERVIFVET